MLSIIIPTYNRSNDLDNCLDSILRQSFKEIEIIVIDDGSIDNTVTTLSSKYSSVKFAANKQRRGVNYCRNKGIFLSHGIYILFLDSDVELINPYQLETMIKLASTDENIGTLGGIYQQDDPRTWGCNFDGSKVFCDDSRELKECDYVSSGNLFMRKKDIYDLRGFDEFIKGDGTESEIGLNLRRKGRLNLISHSTAAWHHMSPVERNNISLALEKEYSLVRREQIRLLYRHRNRLRYLFKNGFPAAALRQFLCLSLNNLISLLAFIKQQFFGLKNETSQQFATSQEKHEVLIFKIKLIFDPLFWNVRHWPETLKSKKINFLKNKGS